MSQKYVTEAVVVTAVFSYVVYRYFYKKTVPTFNEKRTVVIECIEEWNSLEKEITESFYKSKVIGLDCEWVTIEKQRNSVSLLQLANDSGYCVLVRLSFIPIWLIPASLTDLLESEQILKVGVGISDDVDKLFQDYFIQVKNFVDLRYIAKDLKEMEGKNLGLKSLGVELLGLAISKNNTIRCSDWDAINLSEEQINYAADDAIIAAKLFTSIKKLKSGFLFISSHSFNKELNNFIDLPFKQKYISNNALGNINLQSKKTSRKSFYSRPRQKTMYDNCQLVAPDGELLCSCRKAKADWYIYKGLGKKLKDEPFTVQLNFEPFARPTLDDVFYTKVQSNQCVVCGNTKNFHRKFVVLSEYRKYFPDIMKKNLSHDILLLCQQCHKQSNIVDQELRKKLAKLCDAPFTNQQDDDDLNLARVKSAAIALHYSGDKIPTLRQDELKQKITDYYGVSEFTQDILDKALSLKVSTSINAACPHGLKVFEYFCKNGGLLQLERMWRQHFLDTMQPKYLPAMWSVEHHHKRLAVLVVNQFKTVDFDISILGLSAEQIEEAKQYGFSEESNVKRIVKKI